MIMIAILLSTYNGELYLKDQIESIIVQSIENWILYVRDDGSYDGTLAILKEYVMKYPEKIKMINDNLGNIGSACSFMQLLDVTSSEYYMFCDQDDVWFPNKVEVSLEKMNKVEKNNPNSGVLVFTDLRVVDKHLNTIAHSMWKYMGIDPEYSKDFYKTTALHSVTGCTIMINRKLKNIVLPYSNNLTMHDAWISYIASKIGIVDYVEEQTILYRQHVSNVLGVNKKYRFHYLKKFLNLNTVFLKNIQNFKMLRSLPFSVDYLKVIISKINVIWKK